MSSHKGDENRNPAQGWRNTKQGKRNFQRKASFECLERRDLLAVAIWNNVVFPVDVNGDQPASVDPLDALTLINELNGPRHSDPSTGLLPKQIAASQAGPYLDVDCDGRVSPLDVLVVINHINSFGTGGVGGFASGGGTYASAACSPQLIEGTGFATELTRILKVPSDKAVLRVQFGAPAFDTTSQRQIRDAFEIEITDSAGRPVVLPYQSNRDAAYNWSEALSPAHGTGTWSTTGSPSQDPAVSFDLTGLSIGTEIHVAARLVNNDSDNGTSVIIRGFEFVEAPISAPGRTAIAESRSMDSSSIDISRLSNLSGSVQVDYGRTSLSADNNELITELTITNIGSQTVTGPFVVVFEKFSELEINAMRPDGVLPDGRPFIDFTSRLNGVPLAPGQSIASREIRFLNNSGQRFTYELGAYGRLNAAPSRFDSAPLTSIAAKNNYGYHAQAIDEDGQVLSYSLITGPAEMTIDSASGQIAWSTKTTDVGSHLVTIRATDPFGLFIEQSFAIEVLESLQNRPPNFTSLPVLEATASSGFELATVATGHGPSGVAVISGIQGNRLVVTNAQDQNIGVHNRVFADEFSATFSVSTGEPKPNGLPLRSGTNVNLGLPPFLQKIDTNDVLGLDQGDFNGDGILDLAALTLRYESWVNNAFISRYTNEIVVMLGDGNGQFGEPSVLVSYAGTVAREFKHLRASDIDGDGHLDLMCVDETGSSLIVVHGRGNGSFENAVLTTITVALNDFRLVDLDKDGYQDIVGRSGNWSRFGWMKGNGRGAFSNFLDIGPLHPGDSNGSDITIRPYQFADFNKDGHLDIIYARYNESKLDILFNNGNETFSLAKSFDRANALVLYVADFTGDQQLDIVYSTSNAKVPTMLVGDGSGTNFVTRDLNASVASWPGNVAGSDAPIDIDNDGDLDLVIASGWSSPLELNHTYVLLNDGRGNFSSTGYTLQRVSGSFDELTALGEGSVAGALVGDYNRDGVMDIATFTNTNDFNGVGIAMGTRPGEFDANKTIPFTNVNNFNSAYPGDFNGDGIQDLLSMPVGDMRLGHGDGTFRAPFPAIPRRSNQGSTALVDDFNRDGILDIVFYLGGGSFYNAAMGNGDGTFEITFQLKTDTFYEPSTIQSGDFNSDGYLDFVARFGVEKVLDVYLYDPLKPGTFFRSERMNLNGSGVLARGFGGAVAVADFNRDDKMDLAIVDQLQSIGESKKLMTFAGRGDGTFQLINEQFDYNDNIGIGSNYPNFLKSGDINEDGFQDVVTFSVSSIVTHLGKGDGTFHSPDFLPENGCTGGISCYSDHDWGHLVDLDGDRHLDLVYATNSVGNLTVRLGNGDGSFGPPAVWDASASPDGLEFADFDHDGHLDIVHSSGGVDPFASIYYGARDGLVDMVAADLNGDGNEEVLAVNNANDRLKIFVGDNLGGLNRIPDLQTGRAPMAVAVADLDGDNKLEIITANRTSRSISIFTGSLTSGYVDVEYPVGKGPIDVASGNFNSDQYLDIFVLDDTVNAVWMLAGIAAGLFADPAAIALGDRPGKLIIQDATGDNLIDIVVTLPNTNRLLILTGDGTSFGNPRYLTLSGSPADVAVVDLNADKLPDLIASMPDLDQVSILYSRGAGQYASAQHISVGDQPSSLTVSDIDKDGKADILVTNRGDNTATIIYNRFDPNEVYRYDADAIDPDGDVLEYRVAAGPGGLYIHSETGKVFWAASPDQVGQHRVVLEANDGRGGLATQSFFIDVQPAQENALPLIATSPVTSIGGAEKFKYQVHAIDKDRETLRYRLLEGPSGATIDATSGLLEWDGTNDRAFQFNPYASAGYVQVPSDPSLKPTNVTVEGWYQFHSTTPSGANQVLSDMGGPGNLFAYSLYTTKAGKLVLQFDQSSSALNVKLEGNFVPILERWYHFAFTFDDGSGVMSIFVDGELFASRVTDKSLIYGDDDFYLGTNSSSPPHVSIDNFRIWNVARTPIQIAEGLGQQYAGNASLVFDYRFEDQVAIGIRDHSPAKNDGYRMGALRPLIVDGLADMGMHRFVIGVEDGRGGYDTQSFEVNIVPELRGSIAGQLFEDANRDGIKGVGELALKGWVLYLDHNGNAYPDPDEPTATTDVSGKYQFSSLLPGSYSVRVVSVAGYSPVGPTSVPVKANRVATLDRAIEILALGQIQGLVRTETNQPIANWKVFADLDLDALLDENEPVATTDSRGSYAIAGLPAGQYTVRTSLPAGWSNLAGNAGLPVALGPSMISASNNFTLRPTNTSVTGGVHFVTTPMISVEARQVYRYAALAINLNQTSIEYDLSLAPTGMAIDPVRGLIAWRPTIEQVGEHSVIVRATDDSGSIALHDFLIVVNSPNTAPVFATNPPIIAYVGSATIHDFAAQDAEESLLRFSIVSGPTGATIDPASGRFRWTPTASDVGQVNLTIGVTDASNSLTTRSFAIDVTNNAPNALPLLIQLPRNSAAIGHEYLSQIRASDGLRRPVTWSLVAGPSGLTMSSVGLLRWTPISGDLGAKTVRLLATTADGATQGVEFTIEVLGWLTNSDPEITSKPNLSAVAGREYRYQVLATDTDRDSLSFSLLSAPECMSIHPELGIIAWTPALDQLGSAGVTVQVTDATGANAAQSFSLRVGRTGGPPMITSVPGTEAYVGQGYLHTILTSDAEGDTLLYGLLTAPIGMQIASTTGEISWTPSLDQIGQQIVAIEVSDGTGSATTQSFAVRVRDGAPNDPPQIVSRSPRFGSVGTPFSYTVQAVDRENTTITYSLGRGPAGMTVDASTGVVHWTPTLGHVGKSIVTLLASDAGGASAIESFELDVLAENRKPTISSTAPLEVPARAEFRYDVLARDLDLDLLQYRLLVAPAGASMDAFGSIRWSTRTDLIGPHDFQVLVSDPRGGEATQSFRLNVIEDMVPPRVSLVSGSGSARVLPWQGPLTLYAKAIDNVEVASLTATINGQEIVLDALGQATFTFEEWGFTRLNATAKAVDTNGNVTEKSVSFGFSFPEGWGGSGELIPQAVISSPPEAAEVTGMVSISGTASHATFRSYRLSYRRVDQDQYIEFHQSSVPVVNGQLGVWDTTLLENDGYVLRLEVTTAGGVVNVAEHHVGLSGALKLGNFQLQFRDMAIPIEGIPIEVTRVYDSLRADREGDFGFGWRMEYRNADLRVGLKKSALEDIGIYMPYKEGVKVYLNIPGKGRQGFTFTPIVRVLQGFGGNGLVIATPNFTPDRGNTSTLSVASGNLFVNEYGELYASGGIPWNPASPDFGGGYQVITEDDTSYFIDGNTGLMTRATDRNGNTLTFDENGIRGQGARIDFQHDAQGRIISIVDPNDKKIVYQYSASGNLAAVTDRDGNQTRFSYSAARTHFLETVLDPLGRTGIRADYGLDGRLTRTVDALGNGINVHYDPANAIVSATDALGKTTILEYDNRGNIVSTTDALGGIVKSQFDNDNNPIRTEDALGRVTQASFDAAGNTTRIVDPLGNATRYHYNKPGYLVSVIDPSGNESRSNYDSFGNLSTTIDTLGNQATYRHNDSGQLTQANLPGGFRISLGFGSSAAPSNATDWNGQSISLTQDRLKRVTSRTTTFQSSGGLRDLTESMQYDASGRLVSNTDALGNQRRFEYNPLGQTVATIDALGRRTKYEYDATGRMTYVISPMGQRTSLEYDRVGNNISSTDPVGRTTRFAYDALGQLLETILPDVTPESDIDNPRTSNVYDAAGQRIATIDPLGRRTNYLYDLNGNLIRIINPLGESTQFVFDAAGRNTATIDPLGNTTRYVLDARGMQIGTVFADGSKIATVKNAGGFPTRTTDEDGSTTLYEYDAGGKIGAVIDSIGNRTRYIHDQRGKLIEQIDALGHSTTFEYDDLGREVARVRPGGQRSTTQYDAVGNVVLRTDANGQSIVYEFDQGNRLQKKRLPDGSIEEFQYDLSNRLTRSIDTSGQMDYEYDAVGRPVRVTMPDGQAVANAYDAAGQLSFQTSLAGTVRYGYDAAGRLIAVTDPSGAVTRYVYQSGGLVIRTDLPNGVTEHRQYDQKNRLTHQYSETNAATLFDTKYILSDAGRMLSKTSDGVHSRYTYDGAQRIVQETHQSSILGVRTIGYQYDSAGNRLTRTDSAEGTTQYIYNSNDQLVRSVRDGLETVYSYDANGSLLKSESASLLVTNVWDSQSRLKSSSQSVNGAIRIESYRYDVSGTRVTTTTDGIETRYLVDKSTSLPYVIAEYTPVGNLVSRTIFGLQPIASTSGTDMTYFVTDRLGSVVATLDGSGVIKSRQRFDAYGRSLASQGTSNSDLQYNGEPRSGVTGQDYLRARYYDSETGRFTSEDPFDGFVIRPLSRHQYQYADLDPVNNSDPTGLTTQAELSVSTGIRGLLERSSAFQTVLKVKKNAGDYAGGAEAIVMVLGMFGTMVADAAAFIAYRHVLGSSPATFKNSTDFEGKIKTNPLKKVSVSAESSGGVHSIGVGFEFSKIAGGKLAPAGGFKASSNGVLAFSGDVSLGFDLKYNTAVGFTSGFSFAENSKADGGIDIFVMSLVGKLGATYSNGDYSASSPFSGGPSFSLEYTILVAFKLEIDIVPGLIS